MKLSKESQQLFDNIKRDYRISDEAGLLLAQISMRIPGPDQEHTGRN